MKRPPGHIPNFRPIRIEKPVKITPQRSYPIYYKFKTSTQQGHGTITGSKTYDCVISYLRNTMKISRIYQVDGKGKIIGLL